ncbi:MULTISPECIES: MBL fold metallo-hydrolase [Microbacterium]|uniref:MBL fold metallo-hydrolase n=1 Tax=Microbacterium TaxID=33882 RepID=UPI002787DFA5|nr:MULTISPECIES: MBL fold metallo-hydrolase [Microbacterium]MDQ1084822.1 glyoxylase-like metal-dependent hydrolase (beta-lactamase superfamily II) [Microbacterium sp. SORGH_AS_0344]MDQ1169898.1 glyoxylase-like metal-dependent hydrolase (beta-lactamase superfamily II) [Microbacterium proteolyticum]
MTRTDPASAARRDGCREVADGVVMITRAVTNSYLLATDDGLVLIDAGLPRSWNLLVDALAALRSTPDDLVSVYLTHGHFDHVGTLERLQREHHVPVHVHAADAPLVRHPYRYDRESPRSLYALRHPGGLPSLARMTLAGALGVRGVEARGDVSHGVAVLGGLMPIATPGHTYGHVAFHLPDRDVLFAGDALVTFDPYTGRAGPQIVARAATADSRAALAALPDLSATGASTVLPGHGDAWMRGIREAVSGALAIGPH